MYSTVTTLFDSLTVLWVLVLAAYAQNSRSVLEGPLSQDDDGWFTCLVKWTEKDHQPLQLRKLNLITMFNKVHVASCFALKSG